MTKPIKLADYLDSDKIVIINDDFSPKEIVEILLNVLSHNHDIVFKHREEILEAILNRESETSTGIGREVAIPHGRSFFIDDIYISFAMIESGVDWKSSDSIDVKFVFLVIGPKKAKAEEYLQILAQISKLISRKQTKEEIMKSSNKQEILDVIQNLRSRQHPD